MNKIFSILLLIGLYGCAASVSTEQYVGEYEKQKSLDEVEITKVDGLKIVELKINKQLEERYPELAEKRVAFWSYTRNGKCSILYGKIQFDRGRQR